MGGTMGSTEFKSKEEAKRALDQLDEELIEGKISEEEYRRAKASLLGKAEPVEAVSPEGVSEVARKISQMASKLSEIREKREKLRDLLISKEISEATFQKLDSEYEEKEKSLELKVKELEEESRERLKEIEQKLEEIKLMREEMKARHLLGEIPKSEYESKDGELASQAERLEAERESISSALKAVGLE